MKKIKIGHLQGWYYPSKLRRDFIAILIHGASEGFDSSFMKYIAEFLNKNGISVLGFNFGYITNNSKPSRLFGDELEDLYTVIKFTNQQLKFKKQVLIGKSLGGVLSLTHSIETPQDSIAKIIVLGFPVRLGYPINLSIINNPKPLSKFIAIKYVKLLNDLKIPITIIGGDNDPFGSPKDIKNIVKYVSKSKDLKYIQIKNASHGFYPVNNSTELYSNYQELSGHILTEIHDKQNEP